MPGERANPGQGLALSSYSGDPRVVALLFLALLTYLPPAAAAPLRGGLVEVGASTGFGLPTYDRGEDGPRYVVLRSIDYFLNDRAAVGVGLGLLGDAHHEPSSSWTAAITLHGRSIQRVTPFVGLQGGTWADIFRASPQFTGVLGAETGTKVFVSDTFSVNIGCGYVVPVQRLDRGFVTGTLGFSFYRKRGQ